VKPTICATTQASFSAYLDGAVSGHEMQQISRHLLGAEHSSTGAESGDVAPCESCAQEFAAWRATQNALAMLRPAKAPADLGLKLRLAISRERARREVRLRDRLSLTWDNALRPVLLHVSAGVVGTVVLVGSILCLLGFAAPQAVQANDEPLGAMTAPHYLYSIATPEAVIASPDTAIVVEAAVNSAGRVYDYNIVSGPEDDAVRTQVANQLLGSVFQPASVFGLPVRGHVVVTFAGISVHG
jgi:anti-sigma factor RsiW